MRGVILLTDAVPETLTSWRVAKAAGPQSFCRFCSCFSSCALWAVLTGAGWGRELGPSVVPSAAAASLRHSWKTVLDRAKIRE